MSGFYKLQLVTRFQKQGSVLFLKSPTVEQEATAKLEFKDGGKQTPIWTVLFHDWDDETAITLQETIVKSSTLFLHAEIVNSVDYVQLNNNKIDVSNISKRLDTYLENIDPSASVMLHTNIGCVFSYSVRKAREIKEKRLKRKRILEQRRQNEQEQFSRIRRRINVCAGCDDPNCRSTPQPTKTSGFL